MSERRRKVVIDGRGSFHSLVAQTCRMAPREKILVEITHLPIFEALGGRPWIDVKIIIAHHEIKVLPEKDARIITLYPENVNMPITVIDRVGDGFDVYGIIDGKKIPAKDIVFKIPGGPPVTLEEYIEQLLMGLGWALIRHLCRYGNLNDFIIVSEHQPGEKAVEAKEH